MNVFINANCIVPVTMMMNRNNDCEFNLKEWQSITKLPKMTETKQKLQQIKQRTA